MLLNAVAVWVTSPKAISPANSRGAWMASGSGTMICVTDQFQPLKMMVRRTYRR